MHPELEMNQQSLPLFSQCTKSCPSGTDSECFPGSYCFGQITTCSDIDNGAQKTTGNFVVRIGMMRMQNV